MNKELLEKRGEMHKTDHYSQYRELGGILNEVDYKKAVNGLEDNILIDEPVRIQAENIAKHAGIELQGANDPRIVLYGALSGKMTDQRLFREVLRILDDKEALDKLKAAYHTNRPPGTYCPLCRQTRYSEDCP